MYLKDQRCFYKTYRWGTTYLYDASSKPCQYYITQWEKNHWTKDKIVHRSFESQLPLTFTGMGLLPLKSNTLTLVGPSEVQESGETNSLYVLL